MVLYLKEKIWISSAQGCFMPHLVETVPVVLKKKIFKYSPHIFIILLLSPLYEWCRPLFVKIWNPSTQGCFVPNLVEIGPVVLKRGFLNLFNIIFYFAFISPLREACPSFEQTWISSSQGCFVSSLVEIYLQCSYSSFRRFLKLHLAYVLRWNSWREDLLLLTYLITLPVCKDVTFPLITKFKINKYLSYLSVNRIPN